MTLSGSVDADHRAQDWKQSTEKKYWQTSSGLDPSGPPHRGHTWYNSGICIYIYVHVAFKNVVIFNVELTEVEVTQH